jgi:hypothetical protein
MKKLICIALLFITGCQTIQPDPSGDSDRKSELRRRLEAVMDWQRGQ